MTETQSDDDGQGAEELVQGIMDHCFAWLAERRVERARRDGFGPKPPEGKE